MKKLVSSKWVEEAGALRNGLKWLESAKVGLVAHSLQNYITNMTGTLFFMCGGPILSKLRILDSIWKESRLGGKFKSQMVHPRKSRNTINQHAIVENGSRAVRVVP